MAAVAAGLAFAAASPAKAANSSAQAQVVLVQPNTLVNVDDLNFGSIIVGATGGTVTVSPVTNARSSGGGVVLTGNGAARASFQGTGANRLMVINGSNSVALSRVGGGAPTMSATLTRARLTGTGTVALGNSAVVFATGLLTLYVGGTLTIPANQAEGDYVGTFTVNVNYN